jgi:L-ascorbate metabolism protein UlaG (beta-lactamase superfamily)
MELTWLGHSCFRLRGKDATVITDPPAPSTGYSTGRLTADIVTVSHRHPGHSHAAGVAGEPKVVDGPGEYEIKQTLISGVQTYHDNERGKRLGRNTVYLITLDDIHICHLGDLGDKLDNRAQEALEGCDVLLVPVGGGNALNAEQAAQVITQLEPKIVVPMHYLTPAYKGGGPNEPPLEGVERFCREMGVEPPEPGAKLTVTPATLPATTQIVLLNYRG